MSIIKRLAITFKGVCMGAADIVPGVSGGTIALLMGIYNELIDSIKSIDSQAVKLLCRGRFGELWAYVNGAFIVPLMLGIFVSVFSLSGLMKYLMAEHPIQLWSLFFGLIIASSVTFLRGIKGWNITVVLATFVGVALAAYISLATPSQTPEGLPFIFLSGMVAICAMILPGISGSFILLLLGKYEYIMGAIHSLNIPVLMVFGAGATVGLLSFSRLLSWLLARYYQSTIATLAGFMIGSLLKVWPWRLSCGMTDMPVSPMHYAEALSVSSRLPDALLYAAVGVAIVVAIEVFASRR